MSEWQRYKWRYLLKRGLELDWYRLGAYWWSRRQFWAEMANHPLLIPPPAADIIGRIRVDPRVTLRPFTIDLDAFERYRRQAPYRSCLYQFQYGPYFIEKTLEHFLSLQLLEIDQTDAYLDIASGYSEFPGVVAALTGARIWRQDLDYPLGCHGEMIGGTAAHLNLPDASVSKMAAHNSFEEFEGDADTAFIREAERLLRPGGRLCIVPLFLGPRYLIVTDPRVARQDIPFDAGAQVIDYPSRNRFDRAYDVAAFQRRVLDAAKTLRLTLYHVMNAPDIHPLCYLTFAAVFEKPTG